MITRRVSPVECRSAWTGELWDEPRQQDNRVGENSHGIKRIRFPGTLGRSVSKPKKLHKNVSAYRQRARTDLPPCPTSIHCSAIRGKKIGRVGDGAMASNTVFGANLSYFHLRFGPRL